MFVGQSITYSYFFIFLRLKKSEILVVYTFFDIFFSFESWNIITNTINNFNIIQHYNTISIVIPKLFWMCRQQAQKDFQISIFSFFQKNFKWQKKVVIFFLSSKKTSVRMHARAKYFTCVLEIWLKNFCKFSSLLVRI